MQLSFNPFGAYITKSNQETEAYQLALGTYEIPNDGSVLPLGEDVGAEALRRIGNLVSSVGPKILTRKQDGIVGAISVTGSDAIKSYIDDNYDLRFLVERVVRDGIVKGAMGLAIGTDENDEAYVYRLGGFITRIYSEFDADREVGILQIERNDPILKGLGSFEVKLFMGNTVYHWRNVHSLQGINWDRPDATYENGVDYVAFYVDYQADEIGFSIGEMEQLVPILKGIMAVESRIHRVSELYGFPQTVVSGSFFEDEKNPDGVWFVSEGGKVEYLTPASFDNLIRQKVDLFNQLNEIATLPSGFVGQGNQPSGAAIKEANAAFNASIARYARLLSRLFTNAFYEYFRSQGIPAEDFAITITPQRITEDEMEIDRMVVLLEKGLMTPKFIVEMLQRKYEFTDEEAAAVLERFEATNALLTPDDLLNEL
jgi:hypothetical protein